MVVPLSSAPVSPLELIDLRIERDETQLPLLRNHV